MLQKLQEINDAQPDDPRTVEDLFSDDCWPDGSSGPLRPTAGAPTADPPTAAPPSAPVSPGPNKAVVIGGAAGAGALTIAGGVLVGVAEATRSQPNGDTATADALLPPGIVLLVAGGVLGAGTAVYGLWPRDDKPPATVVVPVVGRGTVGLVWSGAF